MKVVVRAKSEKRKAKSMRAHGVRGLAVPSTGLLGYWATGLLDSVHD